MAFLMGQDGQAAVRAAKDGRHAGVVLRELSEDELRARGAREKALRESGLEATFDGESGDVVFVNYLDKDGKPLSGLTDEQYIAQVDDLADRVLGRDVEAHSTRFDGVYLEAPAYYSSLGRDPETLGEVARVLNERVQPVYERYAKELGADSGELARLGDVEAGLRAAHRVGQTAAAGAREMWALVRPPRARVRSPTSTPPALAPRGTVRP